MRKTLLLLILLCGFVTVSFAQSANDAIKASMSDSIRAKNNPIQMSIGIGLGSATGRTTEIYGSTFGLSFNLEIPFKFKGLSLMASAAYSEYNLKSTAFTTDTTPNGHFIPITVGLKCYLNENIYIEGDVGESLNINANYSGYQSGFFYSPVIGLSFPLNQKASAIEVSGRYERRVDQDFPINQVALRVAYKFGL